MHLNTFIYLYTITEDKNLNLLNVTMIAILYSKYKFKRMYFNYKIKILHARTNFIDIAQIFKRCCCYK